MKKSTETPPKRRMKSGSPVVSRVEPLSWWVGMQTPLQLMLYGRSLAGCDVRIEGSGVSVGGIHEADSPDYLFVDVEIAPDARPGDYTVRVVRDGEEARFDYRLDARREGSADRGTFGPEDMVYLVMPDRFAEGDPSRRTSPETVEGVDRSDPSGRHGGDIQGIIDHLDYLSDLGVTTLWPAPVLLDDEREGSYHGYACADYYRVDPRYGDNALYRTMVGKCHERGIKVIMDVVLNHCGTAHWWMRDLPFDDWVHRHDPFMRSNYRLAALTDPHAAASDRRQTVDGWFDTTMPDMALENPYELRYFIQVFVWWIEWADLDGLRVDTFPYNDREAGAAWTQAILREYPALRIVAECWHSSPAIVAYWEGAAHNRDGYRSYLPSVMDFPLQEALNKGLATAPKADWGSGMNLVYEALALDFIYEDPRSLLLFLDNHDIGRFADSVQGDPAKIKLGLTLLATLRGIPQMTYGTEWGFRSPDPSKGDGAARRDFPGGWRDDRKNLFTGRRASRRERDVFDHARRLFTWRKGAEAVHRGRTLQYLPEQGLYVFFRYTDRESVMVVLNPTDQTVVADWKRYAEGLEGYASGVNVLYGSRVSFRRKTAVPAMTGWVVELRR